MRRQCRAAFESGWVRWRKFHKDEAQNDIAAATKAMRMSRDSINRALATPVKAVANVGSFLSS